MMMPDSFHHTSLILQALFQIIGHGWSLQVPKPFYSKTKAIKRKPKFQDEQRNWFLCPLPGCLSRNLPPNQYLRPKGIDWYFFPHHPTLYPNTPKPRSFLCCGKVDSSHNWYITSGGRQGANEVWTMHSTTASQPLWVCGSLPVGHVAQRH